MALQKREYRINIFEQLNAFYSKVFNHEFNFSAHHVSLYLFLIHQNNRNNWVEWFKVPFDLAMGGACIGSRTTYYKCLKDLQEWKLIQFENGANKWKAPKVKIEKLKYDNGQLLIPLCEPVQKPINGHQPALLPVHQLYNALVLCYTSAGTPGGLLVDTFNSNIVTDNIIRLITDNPEMFFKKQMGVDFTVSYSLGPAFKPPVSSLKNINELLVIFSEREEWLTVAAKSFSLSTGEILSRLVQFNAHLTSITDLAKEEIDYASHFMNWLRKKLNLSNNLKGTDKYDDIARQIANR